MLNIAVVYIDKIPYYKEHLHSIEEAGLALHSSDSFLVLGNEYNEDIQGFCNTSCYRHNNIQVVSFEEEPKYQQTFNDTDERKKQLMQSYKNKLADMLVEIATPYGIVIFTHTNVLNIPRINWSLMHDKIVTSNPLYINSNHDFVCGSKQKMIDYLRGNNIIDTNIELLDINCGVSKPEIEKYNILFGFRGFEETCDSERYITRLNDETKQYSFDQMKEYDTIYLSNLNLRNVYKQLKNAINKPFILVTGEGDCECPNEIFDTDEEFNEFIEWDLLKHWFCQNCLITHPKITLIPLGLDYHTMMYNSHIRSDRGDKTIPVDQEEVIMSLRKQMKPFWERIPVCYGNFQFLTITKYGTDDRNDAINKLPSNLIYYDCKHKRNQTFINQTSFAFVVSPFGQDYECIRTWEALCLGCIPIIKKSPLDSLYADLPVILIDDWSEVTVEFLRNKMAEYKEKHINNEFMYEKLHKHYWVKLLQTKKNELLASA